MKKETKLSTLKRLFNEHTICGKEENFTNYCFRYGRIVVEYRNEIEREVFFDLNGIEASVVINSGITSTVRLTTKK